jgi:hypothetical protein
MGVAKIELSVDLLRQLLHFPDEATLTAVKETGIDSRGQVQVLTVYVESPEFDGLGDGMNPVLLSPRYETTTIAKMLDWGIPK